MLLLNELVAGLLIGGVYALFATGLTLSLGVFRTLNFAQGVMTTMAAIVGAEAAIRYHLPFIVLPFVGAAVGAIAGVIVELVAFRTIRNSRKHTEQTATWAMLVVSIGFILHFTAVSQLLLSYMAPGQATIYFPYGVFHDSPVRIGGLILRRINIVMFFVALGLTSITWWVAERTRVGRAMRAVAEDREAATMLGISSDRYAVGVLAASGAMAGVTGVLVGVAQTSVDFTTGSDYLVKAFTIVILGGVGSVIGTFVGGILLGVGEALALYFISAQWSSAVAFGLLMLVFFVRPQGLFGKARVSRV